MNSASIEEKYKVLNHIDHILLRPQTYLGSNKPKTEDKFLLECDKFVKTTVTYIPSFLKIFDEIITNSVDEHKKNPDLNKIEVNLNQLTGEISIKDNGGIPVLIHKEQEKYLPEVIFGTLMSGSSYNDTDERTSAGVNGYGAKLTNIYSSKFTISTCDGKNQFSQQFNNNMRSRSTPIIKKSTKRHTEITYLPDYEKFGMVGLDDVHVRIINKRVIDIAGCNPDIKVYFNNELIDIKSFEDYINFYDRSQVFYETNQEKTWSIAVTNSDDGFQQVSFVNTIDTYDGGNHVDYILNQIISQLRDFFQKKHKVDVKPSEIKTHIFLFINSTIINPSFSSQTKEKMITEVKDFGYSFEVSDKLIKSILKSEIVNSILDWIDQKKNAEENKLTRDLNKNLSKIKVDKLIDAKGKDRWKCSLAIFEGDSAASAFRKYRDSQTQGAYSLKGKFINAQKTTNQKLILDSDAISLMASIGLKLGHKAVPGTLRYGKIIIYTDADSDGNSIAALLINFLYKFWPELFESPTVFKADTPIVVVTNVKNKKNKISLYTVEEYDKWLNSSIIKEWNIEYKKGLAALEDDEYKEIINTPRLTQILSDVNSKESLKIWFGEESELRKIEIMKNNI